MPPPSFDKRFSSRAIQNTAYKNAKDATTKEQMLKLMVCRLNGHTIKLYTSSEVADPSSVSYRFIGKQYCVTCLLAFLSLSCSQKEADKYIIQKFVE